jgi:parallel beta-helix repeat protein
MTEMKIGGRSARAGRSVLRGGVEALEPRRLFTATVGGSPVIYATIQAAVNAAPAGGTVRVSPGTYNELVTIAEPLTVLGAQAGVDARSLARGRNESIVDGQSLVGGVRSAAFDVTANDVTIDGFTVQGETLSDVAVGAGIVLGPSIAGAHVTDDIVQDNVVGLYLSNDGSTDPAVIRHDVFANNNNAGDNSGRGIYTDGGVSGGLLTNVLINANTFTGNVGYGTSVPGGNPEAAVGLEAATAGKQFNVTITDNIMAGNGKGLLVYNASGVTFSGNLVTGSTDTLSAAIRDEGNVTGLTVTDNTVLGGTGAAVLIDGKVVGTPSSNVTVNDNNFAGNAGGGVAVTAGAVTGTLDARFNYWGSTSGPSGAGAGGGQSVSAGVNFAGWLTTPAPTPVSFAIDNGPTATIEADLTIFAYALSLRNLSLLFIAL